MRSIPAVLALLLTASLSAETLRFSKEAPAAIEANQPATWRFTIENVSGGDLPAAPLFVGFGPGRVQSIQPDFGCETTPDGSYRCTMPALRADQSISFEVLVQFPFRYGRAQSGVSVSYVPGFPESANEITVYWKDYVVTSTADSGPGSLRQAILDINSTGECRNRFPDWTPPCRAAFHITEPVPADGWYTIRPITPLPALTAAWDTSIDGTTQTATNPRGPSIALDGSLLAFGHGLTGFSTYFEVHGLAIGGFPWNGVDGNSQFFAVSDCYIGVDPTGQRAHPNGSRGIASSVMRGSIRNNVISGNTRSGIWFNGDTLGTGPFIRNNRIGVAAHDDTPIGNGASGIFIGNFFGYYAYPAIEGNVIANNAHFGVALTANAPMLILGNSIRDNGGAGIDIGLDGPTESVRGVPGVEGGVVPPPVITSARYANGVTTITGYSTAGNNRRQVLLYANSKLEPGGYAEGEQYLGITPVMLRDETAFTFVYQGDLRGKYINGTSSAVTFWSLDEYSFTSSEFGRALAVEE